MDTRKIINDLRTERDRLIRAIEALEDSRDGTRPSGTGRRRRRGPMSASVRKRLSMLMKQRWAARKKAGRKRL